MILPHPESNLKLNIMVLGADLIRLLKTKPFSGKYVFVDDIMEKFLKKDEERTPELFLNTLIFLHTIGSLERKSYKIKLVSPKGNERKQINLFNQ